MRQSAIGGNDTPTSGEWSPTNNTGTANMVERSSYQYDNGGVGDGNLTAYVYSVTTASGSGVNSNDILSAIQHPDPSTGQPSASQQKLFHVDALGDF